MAKSTGHTLGDLIKTTAQELRDAKQDNDADAIMQFRSCEIELAVSAKAEGGGGIRFHIISAGAKVAKDKVSRIKLQFGPMPGDTGGYAAPAPGPGPSGDDLIKEK